MNAAALFVRFAQTSIRAQMQYPASTLMLLVGQFTITAIEMTALFALFDRFGALPGWSLGEVAVFYGCANLSFSLAEAISRGLDVFGPTFVQSGVFDRVLLRPRSAVLQVAGHEFRLSRFGRTLQGLIVLIAGVSVFHVNLTWASAGLIAVAVAGGIAFFTGLFVLQATLAFWTVDSLEVANMLTHGGVTAGQYPLNIYARWFRLLMTYVVPLAWVAYFPIVAALGRREPSGAPDWLLPIAPLMGFAFLGLSVFAWRFGVARYTSTGT
jgi:ABC-2 type transport system permease protein